MTPDNDGRLEPLRLAHTLLPSLIALATLRLPHIVITAFLVGIGWLTANNGWMGLGTIFWAVAVVVSLFAISSAARI